MALGRIVLRVVVGGLFVGHGLQKLAGWFDGPGVERAGAWFESIGMRPGRRNAVAAGATEAAGGAMLVAGLATPLAASALSSVMLTAVRTVHWSKGLWNGSGGYEYNLTLLAALFLLAEHGPGPWSVDHALGIERSGPWWGIGALAGGAIASAVVVELGRRQPPVRREQGAAPERELEAVATAA
jgi:putative oxidoreductase